jgi:hypothetical protein
LIDPTTRSKELEFRDGKRLVPEYLASIMAGLETHRMTFEEAVGVANKRLEADFLNAKQDDVLAAHFREHR